MCLPAAVIAGASAGLSAVSQIGSYMAAKSQAKYQDQVYAANVKAANEDAEFQRVQLTRNRVAQVAAIGQRISAINAGAEQMDGAAIVSAAEGGVSGNVLDDIRMQVERDRAAAASVEKANAAGVVRDQGYAQVGVEAQRVNRINSVERGQKPSFLNLVVGLAGTGLGAADKFGAINHRKKMLEAATTVGSGGTASRYGGS